MLTNPNPTQSYQEAIARLNVIQASEAGIVHPERGTRLFAHDQRQAAAVVFFHGYTSSPPQFAELAARFHALGYNALVMRLAHHGLADRMTNEVKDLRAEELAATADQAVDIACGLGQRIIVCGLSAGGVTAAWAAQNRAEIDLAAIISPGFGFKVIPTALTRSAMWAASKLPNRFAWWDEEQKEQCGPEHSYPRYSTHSLVQILRLGFEVQEAAAQQKPAAKKLLVITNANDVTVNNTMIYKVNQLWKQSGADIETYEFPIELRLDHDLIDPSHPLQRVDIVYPVLIKLIQG